MTAPMHSASTPEEPVHVTSQQDLDDLVDQYDVVLADFYADWCGPCKMIEPTVASIATDTDTVVAKVDVDSNQRLASAFGVRGVPTLVLFAGGEQVEEIVGVVPEADLRSLIDSVA